MSDTEVAPAFVSAGCRYQIGAPIDLADLLALPPDGNSYGRDSQGRLILMSPDDWRKHGYPMVTLTALLNRLLRRPFHVLHERPVAFERVYSLTGKLLPDSFLGPKAIEPDHAVFDRRPDFVRGPHRMTFALPTGVRLVVEILSQDTWRSDLGEGRADKVDKMQTYLEAGVPEYWILNPAVSARKCRVPVQSGLFLSRRADGSGWSEIPVRKGILRSRSIRQLEFDLEAFWRDCAL